MLLAIHIVVAASDMKNAHHPRHQTPQTKSWCKHYDAQAMAALDTRIPYSMLVRNPQLIRYIPVINYLHSEC